MKRECTGTAAASGVVPCIDGREFASSGAFDRVLAAIGRAGKRALDVFLALSLFIAVSPLLIVVALLVAMDGGPVLFSHRRVGRHGVGFGCLKFRTMILDAEQCLEEYLSYHPEMRGEWRRHQKLAFDPRVTGIGKLLRRTSLDELPQLINVMKGEMSLVGPRPVTISELEQYGLSAPLYLSVQPGITGLWQVSGRNGIGYAERVVLDARYVRERSLINDLTILYRTVGAVFSRRGAL